MDVELFILKFHGPETRGILFNPAFVDFQGGIVP